MLEKMFWGEAIHVALSKKTGLSYRPVILLFELQMSEHVIYTHMDTDNCQDGRSIYMCLEGVRQE